MVPRNTVTEAKHIVSNENWMGLCRCGNVLDVLGSLGAGEATVTVAL
jgi:hypothetical protein